MFDTMVFNFLAYAGKYHNKPTVLDAVKDHGIKHDLYGTLEETSQYITHQFDFTPEAQSQYVEKIIKRLHVLLHLIGVGFQIV